MTFKEFAKECRLRYRKCSLCGHSLNEASSHHKVFTGASGGGGGPFMLELGCRGALWSVRVITKEWSQSAKLGEPNGR